MEYYYQLFYNLAIKGKAMGLFARKKNEQTIDLPVYHFDLNDFDELFSLIIIDVNYQIVYASKQVETDFGYNAEELIGQSIDVISVSEINKRHQEDFWKSNLKNKLSECVNIEHKDKSVVTARLKALSKRNGQFWIFIDVLPSKDDPVSSLKESVNLFMELINQTPDIICFKDAKGQWLFANDADLQLFELVGVDYIGKTDAELAHYTPEVYKEAFLNCMETDEKCWQKRKLSRSDEKVTKPDGTSIILDVIKIPVFNPDKSRKNLIVLGRDVTARRKAETELVEAKLKAEESDRLKSNFLATMSHELRTPLNAVIGFANLIFEEEEVSEIHEYSRIINNNAKMLLNLIEDVFDVSLLESQQIEISHHEFDLIKVISEVYEIFPVELNMLDKLDIEFKLIFDREKYIYTGDEFRIKQILTNLIRNALKFTKEGFIHIKLFIFDNYLDVKIIDSGIGISSEKLTEIFGLFRQVEEGTRRSFGGAGLGLSISKKLAEMMNGDILVESELNKGSTFTLRLPLHQ